MNTALRYKIAELILDALDGLQNVSRFTRKARIERIIQTETLRARREYLAEHPELVRDPAYQPYEHEQAKDRIVRNPIFDIHTDYNPAVAKAMADRVLKQFAEVQRKYVHHFVKMNLDASTPTGEAPPVKKQKPMNWFVFKNSDLEKQYNTALGSFVFEKDAIAEATRRTEADGEEYAVVRRVKIARRKTPPVVVENA